LVLAANGFIPLIDDIDLNDFKKKGNIFDLTNNLLN